MPKPGQPYRVICQIWMERAWVFGVRRAGFSLHANQADLTYCLERQDGYNHHGDSRSGPPPEHLEPFNEPPYWVTIRYGSAYDIQRIEYQHGIFFRSRHAPLPELAESPDSTVELESVLVAVSPDIPLPNGGWRWSDAAHPPLLPPDPLPRVGGHGVLQPSD